jgi:hypothetical protein
MNILTYGTETVLEFIQNKIRKNDNVSDILKKIPYIEDNVIEGELKEDRSSQGFYYERLWDLCIKFGATNLTLPAIKSKLQTSHIINENPNKEGIVFKVNCWDNNTLNKNPGGYLFNKVRSGNSGGYSDITFLNKKYEKGEEYEELIFISVKYFQEEKQISEYDIGKLCSLIREHEKKNRDIKLYIFVKNKKDAIEKFNSQHTSSNILIKYINPHGNYEHIYDIHDLQAAFFKLKKILEQYNYLESSDDIQDFQRNYLNVLKDIFIPRFHQKLFILKIKKLIEDEEKNVLVGAIPRSGKSYIMAGTILEYIKSQEELDPSKRVKIIMMTPAPNETFGEYELIFNKYKDFDKLDVVIYKDGVKSKNIFKGDKHSVVIISKQKLGWSSEEDEEKEKEEDIKTINERIIKLFGSNPDIDMMFLDEAHFGMSTPKAEKIVEVLNKFSNTIKIYVTATYNKPLRVYGVKANCKITWDMNDIKIMQYISEKNINDNAIRNQFGPQIYDKTLEYFGDKTGILLIDNLKREYGIFPKPYMITTIWDKDYLNVEKLKIGDTEFGWDMNKLFSTVGSTFANEEQMKEMMRYYFGSPDKKEDYNRQPFYRTRGIIPRIRNICTNNCRTLQPQHKTSQLWFLPLGEGKIKDKTIALVNLLTLSNEFKDIKNSYHFFVAVDVEDKAKKGRTINGVTYMGDPHNIKDEIEKIEKKIEKGDIKQDNLIILSGKRLQLGISLRNVDIVTLWNSITSSDAIFQILFRSMTEVERPECMPNDYCNQKKFGFMVDMNPQRSMTTTTLFGENLSKNLSKTKEMFTQITDLINIDEDVFLDKYEDDTRAKFVNDLFDKFYQAWNASSDDIKKTISKFSFNIAKLEKINLSLIKINKNKSKIIIDEPVETVNAGKKTKRTQTKEPKEKEETEKDVNLNERAAEIISEYISLLNIFTLYEDKGSKCILSDKSKVNSKMDIIYDINSLRDLVYSDDKMKDTFLKILNGRLLGDNTELFPEGVINEVLDAMYNPNDKLIINKIIMSQKKEYYNIHNPDKLLEFIDSKLKPNKKDKSENGEVFTPLVTVGEMLDKLDDAYKVENGKSIFTEQSLKWFDPAVGIGNFPIVVYQRLMEGLPIKDEEERRKHILENMIYSAELTSKNVFIYKKIFCGDKYNLNIYEGDTLNIDVKKKFNVSGFDVVMGNPPYNANGTKHVGDKNIYVFFSKKTLDNWLKESGYLVFIHPPVYRIPHKIIQHTKTNLNEIYTTKKICFIKMYSLSQTQKLMSVMMNVDFIIVQNAPNDSSKTKIIDTERNETERVIGPNDFIPNFGLNIMEKIKNKNKNGKVELINNSEMHAQKIQGTLYKNIHGIVSDGIKICFSDKKHRFFDIPKLIINGIGSYNYVFYDKKGEYGLTQSPFYILTPSENTLILIQSPLFHYISNSTRIIGNNFNKDTSIFLPIISPDIKIKNDTDLYNYFDFTQEEINSINKYTIPTYKNEEISCGKDKDLDEPPENSVPVENSKRTIKRQSSNTLKLKKLISERKAQTPNVVSNGKTLIERKRNTLKGPNLKSKLSTIVNVNSRSQKNSKN